MRHEQAVAWFATCKRFAVGSAEIGMDFSAVRFQILDHGTIRPDQALSAVRLADGACAARGEGPRKLQCFECARPDPMKSDAIQWLQGQLQPPK